MTAWMFRAWWPMEAEVRNPAELVQAGLIDIASDEVDALVAEQGCRLLGPLQWRTADGHLIAEAPAEPIAVEVAA